jgi:RNA recognition motif-containing protein
VIAAQLVLPLALAIDHTASKFSQLQVLDFLICTTDRGDRYQRESLPLPTKPPYTAHLGNLPFDATQEHIEDFFSGCEVTSVRIVEDKIERRPKGFGYVEFASLDGLKRALELNMTQFRGRNIKISVADARTFKSITYWSFN